MSAPGRQEGQVDLPEKEPLYADPYTRIAWHHARNEELVARLHAARLAMQELLDFAEYADRQVHGEWGVGEYEEADEVAKARAWLAGENNPA